MQHKNIKNLEHFTKDTPFLKISKNTGTTPLLINPDKKRWDLIHDFIISL
jgi:hypothetical protein